MARFHILVRLAAVGFVGSFAAWALPQADAASFRVDSVHSSLQFRVKHMDTSYIWGRFNEYSGTVNLDDDNPSFAIQIKVGSVDTANAKRDQHLEGPDFFSAKQFPTITFQSTTVQKLGPTTYDVQGTLKLHGVSKPITIRVDRVGTNKGPMGGTITGLSTTFTIKRTDFGMDYGLQGVADEVLVQADLECAGE
jgi:polyisoprenoid-binding protein YceI